ncbi:uncharacterized protein LOC111287141 [Durio zibethinus]|uniref:Uncharacterized protein LOC111287141 n=1 Tax=Durio zibethinus TaxID=66656 RepID=A0A6P5XY95_DURZI|nr:uncharacterized protein LOC111287141 [Durio zibethinus]
MAEKEQQVHPLAPANDHPRSDEESASRLQSKELKRKKRTKYIYIILVFVLAVLRVKNPKVRIGRVNIETMEINNTVAAASFDLKFIAQVTVKNTNFSHYKFDNSTMTFLYNGIIVGEAIIPKATARARSTKKLDFTVEVNSRALTTNTALDSELSSNVLTVELMKVMRKKKSPEMNCTLTFNLSTRNLQDLNCK